VDRALEEEARLWPDPLVQLSPSYAMGATVDELAQQGLITRETAEIFRSADGKPFRLYRHQEEAIRRALPGESFVVTSGTGSGKSLCYFLPMVDNLIRHPETGALVAAPAPSGLLTHHGAGCGHRRPGAGPLAQRPAYACQLCPAQRKGGQARATRARCDLLRCSQQP
jgi:hypothetical protein